MVIAWHDFEADIGVATEQPIKVLPKLERCHVFPVVKDL